MLPVKQSINLYSAEFRPPELPAGAKRLLQVCGAIMAVNLVLFILLLAVQGLYKGNLQDAQFQQQALTERLNTLTASLPKRTPDATLVARLEREKEAILKRRKVIEYLRNDSLYDSNDFVAPVAQLEQQDVEGIWLSRFSLLNKGQDIELYGLAKQPKQVSAYLSQLSTRTAYEGRAFRKIEVMRSEHGNWSEFFLSTRPDEAVAEEEL